MKPRNVDFAQFRKLTGLLVIAAGLQACAPAPAPPIVVPQPPPALRLVQATIRGDAGVPAHIVATLATDEPYAISCPVAEGLPRIVCTLDAHFPNGDAGGHLTIGADEYETQTINLLLTGRSQDLPDVALVSSWKPLPRLVVDGQFFRQADGALWTAAELSDFNLYARYLAGEDITPILRQRADGFSLLRVFTAFNVCADGSCSSHQPIGLLVPREHADYYTRLPEFLKLCARHGLYVELVAFTGPYETFFANDDAKVAHWNSLIAAIGPSTNVLLELVNEHDHVANKNIPFDRLQRPPPPILASHGSGQADGEPRLPLWSYATYHPGFGDEWPRKAIHNGWEDVAQKYSIPVLVNETTRFPDSDGSLAHAYDVGRGCTLMVAGCAFHSVEGKNSRLWTEPALGLARAWAQGVKDMPLRCQRGQYRRIDDDRFSRVYEHVGVGEGCRVEVRR